MFVHGKCQYPLHLGIIECADHDSPEIERDGLRMDVLSRVPDLQLHVTFGPLFVLPSCPLEDCGKDNRYRCIRQPALF